MSSKRERSSLIRLRQLLEWRPNAQRCRTQVSRGPRLLATFGHNHLRLVAALANAPLAGPEELLCIDPGE
jgi:hypothetical protein